MRHLGKHILKTKILMDVRVTFIPLALLTLFLSSFIIAIIHVSVYLSLTGSTSVVPFFDTVLVLLVLYVRFDDNSYQSHLIAVGINW